MRAFVEKTWVRLLALTLFFLFSGSAVLTISLYSTALEDGWYGEGYTFAETQMANSYVTDALGFVSRNLTWLEDPSNDSLGSYAGDAFAYVIKDAETGKTYADTTNSSSHFVTDLEITVESAEGGSKTFLLSGYVNLPVQPYSGCYREYYVFEELFPLRRMFLPLGILFALLALLALAVCIAGSVLFGRTGRLTSLGKLPFDAAAAGIYIGVILAQSTLYGALGSNLLDILSQLGIYSKRFHACFMLWYWALLLLIVSNQLAGKCFFDRLVLRRLIMKIRARTLVILVFAVHMVLLLTLLGPSYGFDLPFNLLLALMTDHGILSVLWYLVAFDVLLFLGYIRWNKEKNCIRDASAALAAGNLSYKVNEEKLHFIWRSLGRDLNSIGDGMALAVEERLRSERMKTELITNVSHDLKTPLTSIINYIELLKAEGLSPETQKEYLAVLNKHSIKLKKLTEDVLEASKAASGVIPVNAELLDVRELLEQAVGEYIERLTDAGIKPVLHMAKHDMAILADGRLLGRVLDNFITNIIKYAQPGTRAYFDLSETAGETVIAVKNTSRAPLDIPADELMERFVRGDSSRSTEGSGLGLSIARSLTELMGGKMHLKLDGDLFKVEILFPSADPPAKKKSEEPVAAAAEM